LRRKRGCVWCGPGCVDFTDMRSGLLTRASRTRAFRVALAVGMPTLVWLAAASVPELQQGALFLAPFCVLLALWCSGIDPTPLLHRARCFSRSSRRSVEPSRSLPKAPARIVAGGRLIAASLAGRAPPAAFALTVN
jgi:hypothetical protein